MFVIYYKKNYAKLTHYVLRKAITKYVKAPLNTIIFLTDKCHEQYVVCSDYIEKGYFIILFLA